MVACLLALWTDAGCHDVIDSGVIYLQNMNPPLFDTKAIRLFQVEFEDEKAEEEMQAQALQQKQAAAAATAATPEEQANPAAAPGTPGA